ncbi:MAG: hypothetical protein QW434_09815 [Pyrobaculum sp.]
MLLAAGFVPSLLSLSALKSRALRKGVWFRLNPAARALVDAAILYLKRGGRVKSPALINALRAVAERIMAMTSPLRVLARAVGMAIARARGIAVDEEKAIALGIQWINTPMRYKSPIPVMGT